MVGATLKSLHMYPRLIENPSELKRRMPTSSNPRSLREGLSEMSKFVGLDNAAFKDPQNISSVIGPQRFVMISGEPSLTNRVTRVFDSTKVLLTVLMDPTRFADGEETREQANQEIADHLIAFARPFTADSEAGQIPAV
jgi:hypothetical protein